MSIGGIIVGKSTMEATLADSARVYIKLPPSSPPPERLIDELGIFSADPTTNEAFVRKGGVCRGEKNLLLAIFEWGRDDATKPRSLSESVEKFMWRREDALEWVRDKEREDCFSFNFICDWVLRVDPDAARAKILKQARIRGN